MKKFSAKKYLQDANWILKYDGYTEEEMENNNFSVVENWLVDEEEFKPCILNFNEPIKSDVDEMMEDNNFRKLSIDMYDFDNAVFKFDKDEQRLTIEPGSNKLVELEQWHLKALVEKLKEMGIVNDE